MQAQLSAGSLARMVGHDLSVLVTLTIPPGHFLAAEDVPGSLRKLAIDLSLPPGVVAEEDWIAWHNAMTVDVNGRPTLVYQGTRAFSRALKCTEGTGEVEYTGRVSFQEILADGTVKPPGELPLQAWIKLLPAKTEADRDWVELENRLYRHVLKEDFEEEKRASAARRYDIYLRLTQRQQETVVGLAGDFFRKNTGDERRRKAFQIYMGLRPLWIAEYPEFRPYPERGADLQAFLRAQEDHRADYFKLLRRDEVAFRRWKERGAAMAEEIIASPESTDDEREEAAWMGFGLEFGSLNIWHSYARTHDGWWKPFAERFKRHMAKYGTYSMAPNRADDYLGALEKLDPEAAAVGWKEVLHLAEAGAKDSPAWNGLLEEAKRKVTPAKLAGPGLQLEAVKFTALDGQEIDLSQMKGKVVLLDFWGTWCAPCVLSMPGLKRLYDEYQDNGFEIIGFACDGGTRENLKAFLDKNGYNWPQHFDGRHIRNRFALLFEVNAFPTTYLVGKDGNLIGKNLHGAELETAIRKALSL